MPDQVVHPLDEFVVAKLKAQWGHSNWGAWKIRDLDGFCAYANALAISMSEASPAEVSAYLASLKGEYRTHAKYTLRAFFEELRATGTIAKNPTAGLKKKRDRPTAVPINLSREDVNSWLDYLRECAHEDHRRASSLLEHARIWMIHELVYATGLKISQINSLRRSDLCKKLPAMVIDTGQGRRTIPITMTAYRAIHHYQFLFIGYVGEAGEWILAAQRDVSRRCGHDVILRGVDSVIAQAPPYLRARISTDAIRFAYAAHLIEGGMSSTELAFIAGLANPVTLELQYPTLFG